jgi:hypothetical protein
MSWIGKLNRAYAEYPWKRLLERHLPADVTQISTVALLRSSARKAA